MGIVTVHSLTPKPHKSPQNPLISIMKKLIVALGLFVALAAAIDIKDAVKEAQERWDQEQNQKVRDGLTTPVSKRRKVTPETKAMKKFNSVVSNTLKILKMEDRKDKKTLSMIANSLSSPSLGGLTGSIGGYGGGGGGDDVDIADICNGIDPDCSKVIQSPFRTFTGVCNNLNNPRWGSTLTSMRRWRDPAYQDMHEVPRGGHVLPTGVLQPFLGRKKRSPGGLSPGPQLIEFTGPQLLPFSCSHMPAGDLPNPRVVSNMFHPDNDIPDNVATHMVAIMGQFADHDMTLTPEEEAEGCCVVLTQDSCFSIGVYHNDSFFASHHVRCLDFTRSLAFCEDFFDHREQINGITAFVDASNVYGSTKGVADSLRTFSNGLMAISTTGPYDMLPLEDGIHKAGDIRAMENPALASMHTLFVREHNRIAKQIHDIDPSLHDEKIYQLTRRIVSAEMQNVVYGQYLQMVVDPELMQHYDLVLEPSTNYEPNTDPSISNVFATAAYRFGHSMIEGLVDMVNEVTRVLEIQYELQNNFFNPANYLAFNGAGMEKILAGLVNQPAQRSDRFVVDDVTNHLFPEQGASFGSDLIARNIQRGRDHGLASYNAYREFCGLTPACAWQQRPAEISPQNWEILEGLYDHPNDIDVFVGGLAERPWQHGLTGRTFQCIKAEQFRALKYGDRYFFTHQNEAGSFTTNQIENLLHRNLGEIICDNTNIKYVRTNVFDANSPWKDCDDRNELEIGLFL